MDGSVQKKKLNKAKLKKTIKNVICRPDYVLWPVISDDHKNSLALILGKYKLALPEYKRPHWKEIKLLPKDVRPKAPRMIKHDGLLFGVNECSNAIKAGQCSGVVIESTVNPRVIVQPLLEACLEADVPVICMETLRKISKTYFGIPTSSLGIKCNHLLDLANEVTQIAKHYKVSQNVLKEAKTEDIEKIQICKNENTVPEITTSIANCPYLYRTNTKTRVFVPSGSTASTTAGKDFMGQNYIELSDKPNDKKLNSKAYMKMMLKRVSNNPNRVKLK